MIWGAYEIKLHEIITYEIFSTRNIIKLRYVAEKCILLEEEYVHSTIYHGSPDFISIMQLCQGVQLYIADLSLCSISHNTSFLDAIVLYIIIYNYVLFMIYTCTEFAGVISCSYCS